MRNAPRSTKGGVRLQGAPGVPAGGSRLVPAVPQQRARKAAHGDGGRGHYHAPAKVGQQGRACSPAKAGRLDFVGWVCCRGAGFSDQVLHARLGGWRQACAHLCRRGFACEAAGLPVKRCAWHGDSELGRVGGTLRARACHSSPLRLSGAFLSGAGLQARACERARRSCGPTAAENCRCMKPKSGVCLGSARSCKRCRPAVWLWRLWLLLGPHLRRPLPACLLRSVLRSRLRQGAASSRLSAVFYLSESLYPGSVARLMVVCLFRVASDFLFRWGVPLGPSLEFYYGMQAPTELSLEVRLRHVRFLSAMMHSLSLL